MKEKGDIKILNQNVPQVFTAAKFEKFTDNINDYMDAKKREAKVTKWYLIVSLAITLFIIGGVFGVIIYKQGLGGVFDIKTITYRYDCGIPGTNETAEYRSVIYAEKHQQLFNTSCKFRIYKKR